jgi:hypothetical protein
MEILQPIYEMQIPITSASSPKLACRDVALAEAGKHDQTLPRITRMQTDYGGSLYPFDECNR